ncbi:type IV pilus modification protein PilV [Parendozoicomonas haliclonae]|uniref:Type IV pilus modification protein PilV n=1 Tax=Parendozoicomonas haliclonae TaxID=1960125 RepID=A0A1X7AGM7_9GAMM|nr:type IV pilus modification protein PilV [Parendozoicomonas haliclonae]SMA40318.1 hypothetical protein EHSB41UT_01174 [Parendozoicomonas haliclonae]
MKNVHKKSGVDTGFSLIEVLVSLLILSIGILGMLALQGYSMKSNINTEQKTHALLILDGIEETVLADADNKGKAICKADALKEFSEMLSDIDPTAELGLEGGAGAPCPTGIYNNLTVYKFQITFQQLTGLTSASRTGPEEIVMTREVKI